MGFTFFYSLLAIGLLILWGVVQTRMVWRAKRNQVWTGFLCLIAIILLGLTVLMGKTPNDQLTGIGSVLILLVLAFWPKGLTKTSLIANLNTVRQFPAISKIELTGHDELVEACFYAGEIRIAKLQFKTTIQGLRAFLKPRFPEQRLVVNQG